MELVYSRKDQMIYLVEGDSVKGWECRNDFVQDPSSENVQESLPLGSYTVSADEPPAQNNAPYGTFYITTGDPRGRDIHGGGSGCEDPLADRQGWCPTYGCLRMQNADGQELSRLIIDAGNSVPLTVQEESI